MEDIRVKAGPFLMQVKEWKPSFIKHNGSFAIDCGLSNLAEPFLLSWQDTIADTLLILTEGF